MRSDKALWQAINAYDIDAADAVLPFSRRLARDNDWSHAYAQAVVAEYKRFVYLACTSGTVVTPSEDVDQAWHLHLIYTRNYWDRFCGEVLKRPLHHMPTEGGKVEDGKYFNAYAGTLSLYESEFGQRPPAAIWPDPAQRFNSQIRQSEVIRLPKRQVFLCLAAGLPLVLAACNGQKVAETLQANPVTALIAFGIIGLVIATVRNAVRHGNGRGRGDGSSGCGSSGCGSSDSDSSGDGGSSGGDSSGCGGGCGGGGD